MLGILYCVRHHGAHIRHNKTPPKPKVKKKNIIFRPENWKWDEFDDMCSHMKRIVCKVRSDGYCLLNAVKDSLLHDYDNLVTLRKMKEEITKYLCERNEKISSISYRECKQHG